MEIRGLQVRGMEYRQAPVDEYETRIPDELADLDSEMQDDIISHANAEFPRLEAVVYDPERDAALVDDHLHAFPFLTHGSENVYHVDKHPDDSPYIGGGDIVTMMENLEITNYLDAAKKAGLIENVERQLEPREGEDLLTTEFDSFILDVDLDFFNQVPEASEGKAYYELARHWEGSDFAVFATSPGFIDQKEALKHFDGIVEAYEDIT